MKMKRKSTAVLVAALVAACGLWFALRPSKQTGITLETAATSRITIRNSVTATGTVEPVTEVEVGTQVSGIIDRLYVDYNDVVKAGQLIAEMDKVTLQAELESSQAELASCKTEYEYRMKEYSRTRTLHEKELVSDAEYDEALYLYEKARNAYEQAQAAIVKVKRNLGYATITSPIDGVVISRAVEEGQTVAAGFETPTLFTIANDLTQMQVVADVDEADIGQVSDGQRVEFTVDAYPDDTFEGVVEQVRLEATTESSVVTYEVVITAYNPELKLKPGLTANVTIFTLEKDDALAVPTKALRFVPDGELLAALGLTAAACAQKLKGSDTLLPLAQKAAENYSEKNPSAHVTVTGGGSGVGLSSLREGTTDIAMASRRIKFDERVRMQQAGRPVEELTVAFDALAVIVHPSNPVSRLTREQLEGIFRGKITNWKQVGGEDRQIVVYSRETSSGTYEFFKESVLKHRNYMPAVLSMPATGAIIQSVSQTPGAIGYVGLAYLNPEVKALAVSYDGGGSYVDPTFDNARSKSYPIVRPLYFYYTKSNEAAVRPLVDYLTSDEGQAMVASIGFIPIR